MREITIEASLCDCGTRLDCFLATRLEMTRSAAQQWLAQGLVTCQGTVLKKNHKLTGREVLHLCVPEPEPLALQPEPIALDVVYEDDDLIVINKPRGMVVHPAAGHSAGTLVNALLYHCGDSLSGINGTTRPGIVHRIDKDTSGLLVVAKNDSAHQSLSAQIAAHTARRSYRGVVLGHPREAQGTVDKPIGRHKTDRKRMAIVSDGKYAVTHYQVLTRFSGYSDLFFTLETGRTHQIRVHMASIGHPLAGDMVYGRSNDRFSYLEGQCLHATQLCFTHPRTGQPMQFDAPLPYYYQAVLEKLGRMN